MSRPLPPTLIPSLNALLAALDLPFTLDAPTDLTPSLLLAILESLINARLPIPATVRASRTRDARARAMLVLLGVLECDVLRGGVDATDTSQGPGSVSIDGWADDIGLGEVDPENLADGGWDETVFVGELMCWLARRKGIIPRLARGPSSSRSQHTSSMRSVYPHPHSYTSEDPSHEDFSTSLLLRPSHLHPSRITPDDVGDSSALSHITDVPRHPLVHSPEHSLSETTATDLSIRIPSASSRTSVSHGYEDTSLTSNGTAQPYSYYHDPDHGDDSIIEEDDEPPIFRPRCIHELDDPSYIRALGNDPSSSSLDVSHSTNPDEHDEPPQDTPPYSDDEEEDVQDHEEDLHDPHPYAPPTPTPRRVRLTGWIDQVDTKLELSAFMASRSKEASRNLGSSGTSMSDTTKTPRNTASGSRFMPRAGPQVISLGGTKSRQDTVVSPIHTPTHAHATPSGDPSSLSTPVPASKSKSILKTPSSSSSLQKPKTATFASSSSKPVLMPEDDDDDDPSFDISFSAPLNTSTPAKPKPKAHVRIGAVNTQERRRRSPSYTPSPPSFSNSKTPAPHAGSHSRQYPNVSSKYTTTVNSDADVPPPSTRASSSMKHGDLTYRLPASYIPPSRTPPLSSSTSKTSSNSYGSTTTKTSSLLNERARLLTELAALKRARAASGGGVVGV